MLEHWWRVMWGEGCTCCNVSGGCYASRVCIMSRGYVATWVEDSYRNVHRECTYCNSGGGGVMCVIPQCNYSNFRICIPIVMII